jgi:hypothetical protein
MARYVKSRPTPRQEVDGATSDSNPTSHILRHTNETGKSRTLLDRRAGQ